MEISDISTSNSSFWNELCGTQLAISLGVNDSSKESLKKFDSWYWSLYPYLKRHIPVAEMKNKTVLEIGLGYGTVSQWLAEAGTHYVGLDIAKGPVEMVNLRLKQNGLSGVAKIGSILNAPFHDESFDFVVAIGSLHHTGDLARAIKEAHRILKPGGTLIFMVYYAYSYRRIIASTRPTLNYLGRELKGFRGVVGTSSDIERGAYDKSADGTSAPHTDWISVKSLKRLCHEFSRFSSELENFEQELIFKKIPRMKLINTPLPKLFGLDLYATAIK